MTMRLDIVTNDAGELVRREHARELGAGVVVAIYRLAKLAQMHDLKNQAFLQQLEGAHQIIGEYCLRAGIHVKILFAHRAVFVAGQLLKGTRQTYEQAAELGEMMEHLGGSELAIQRDITVAELRAFAEAIAAGTRSPRGTFVSPTPRIQLRPVADAARLRGLEIETMPPDQKIVRTYASAVVILRRFFEDLHQSKYVLPRRIKRVAQSLVDLSEGDTLAFLGVTEARNANHDEAGRAVNAAVLAVAMAREITQKRSVLAQIAMASMMHDVARPRGLAAANAHAPGFAAMATSLSEEQEDQLAGASAAVLTALGRVNEPSITRTVITFEALWLRRQRWIGPVYGGAKLATLHARIMWVARRYNDLLTPEPGLVAPSPEEAIGALAGELTEPEDQIVLRMLVSALGILPKGTEVQLSTGEVCEVVTTTSSAGGAPVVKVLVDSKGALLSAPLLLDLGELRVGAPTIERVISIDGWVKSAEPRLAAADSHAALDYGEGEPSEPVSASRDELAARSTHVAPAIREPLPPAGPLPPDVAPPPPEAPPGTLHTPEERTLFQASHFDAEPAPPEGLVEAVAPSPPSTRARRNEARPEPSARGTLAQTPVPHVLVYMLDHELTGSVVFAKPDGDEHVAYFSNGVPTKIALEGAPHRIGDVLVSLGAIAPEAIEPALEAARASGGLVGDAIVKQGRATREVVDHALAEQLSRRVADLSNLGDPWVYSFYRDFDVLEGWGGTAPVTPSPVDAVLASIRAWQDRERVQTTLGRLAKHPLKLHPDADVAMLMLSPAEVALFHRIVTESPPTKTLLEGDKNDVGGSLVYALAVTRQFNFKGQKKGPMAPRGSRAQSERRAIKITRGSIVPRKKTKPPSKPPSIRSSAPAAPGAVPQVRQAVAPVVGSTIQGVQGQASAKMPVAPPSSPVVTPSSKVVPATPAKAAPPAKGSSPDVTIAQESPPAIALPIPLPVRAPPKPVSPKTLSADPLIEAMSSARLADAALQKEDFASAEKLAVRAVQLDPKQPEYKAILAWAKAHRLGDKRSKETAIFTMSAALREDPTNARVLLYRGRLHRDVGNTRLALKDFEDLLQAQPAHSEAQQAIRDLRAKL